MFRSIVDARKYTGCVKLATHNKQRKNMNVLESIGQTKKELVESLVGAPQGSSEWMKQRLGIPTASKFGDVMAMGKKNNKPLRSRIKYMYQLVSERITGEPPPQFDTPAMARGRDLEPTVISLYESRMNAQVVSSEFVRSKFGYGCSPDGLVGNTGLIEVKTSASHIFLEDIMESPGSVPDRFYWQIVGQCMIMDRQWCDMAQYCHPLSSLRIIRVFPNKKDFDDLTKQLDSFMEECDAAEFKVRKHLEGMYLNPSEIFRITSLEATDRGEGMDHSNWGSTDIPA